MLIEKFGHCLITGGTGFIGKRLLCQLDKLGVKYKLLLRQKMVSNNAVQILCDLGESEIPDQAFDGVDTVFHLAGYAHDVNNLSSNEDLYSTVNVRASEQLILKAVEKGVKKFIYVSSVKAGGLPHQGICADELQQGTPDGIYGKTKREAELLLLKIGKENKIHVSIIRPTLVYGVGVKGHLSLMIDGIKKGWFPPLPDTKNIRSMIHVDDLVNSILLVALKDRGKGEIFIVTDGKKYSSREIYNEICFAVGKKIPKWSVPVLVFYCLAKLGDVLGSYFKFPFDSSRYQKLLCDECYCSDKIRNKLGFQSDNVFADALSFMIEKK